MMAKVVRAVLLSASFPEILLSLLIEFSSFPAGCITLYIHCHGTKRAYITKKHFIEGLYLPNIAVAIALSNAG